MEQVLPSELNIFEPPSLSAPFQKVQYVEYRSASPLNDGGPIQFIIPPTANQFIDLKRTLLHVEAKIVRTDGKDLDGDDKWGPINLTLHSFFKQVDVELQQQLVSSNQLYGYKAYLDTILGYNAEAGDTYLQSQMWYKDQTGTMDVHIDPRVNRGLHKRSLLFKNGTADMEGPLMSDVCQQDRLILNNVEVNVKLWPNRNEFFIMTSKDHLKIEFQEVYLKVCKVTPVPSITFGLMETLKDKPALYPFIRTEARSFQLQAGQFNFHLEDLYQQHVPAEVIVCMVHAEAFTGSIKHNPYNFQDFKIKELTLYVDDESVPSKPLSVDIAGWNYVEAYNMLFENPPEKTGTSITRDDFNDGFTIFRFRVTPDQVSGVSCTPSIKGNVFSC